MRDDLLAQSTSALREQTSPDVSAGAGVLGKRRLMRALQIDHARPRRVSRGRRWAILAVAASFVGAAAWAGTSTPLRRWLFSHDSTRQAPDSPAMLVPAPMPPPPPRDQLSAPVEPVHAPPAREPVVEGIRTKSERVAKGARLPEAVSNRAMSTPPQMEAAPASAPDLEALYRQANDAQFVEGNFPRAVALWERYLTLGGPAAPMSLEARYHRGIALYRAGRKDEAKKALEPFARGEYGAYRRDDAKRLLEQL